jgi:hypothetical protein
MAAVALLIMAVGFIIITMGKRLRVRGVLWALVIILFLAVGSVATLRWMFRHNMDIPSMIVDARDLIQNAGGTDKICEEADQLFNKYGTKSNTLFTDGMLDDYPAINSLKGRWCWIEPGSSSYPGWPGEPAMLEVMAGTHFDGFFIDIVQRDSPYKYQMRDGIVVIEKDRIYIHR